MKVLIVSDTHGSTLNFERVYNKVKPVDAILHLGDFQGQNDLIRALVDCPVYFVKGNCDMGFDEEIEQEVTLGGIKIFMTHGHKYFVKFGDTDRLKMEAHDRGVQVALYGHTHVPDLEWDRGIWIANPGSISNPRQANGKPSFLIMETDRKGEILFSQNYLEDREA